MIAYLNTITVIEAIFKFRTSTRDLGPQRGEVWHPQQVKKKMEIFFFNFSIFLVGNGRGVSLLMGYHIFEPVFFLFSGKNRYLGQVAIKAIFPFLA